jgi:hypothetical protein
LKQSERASCENSPAASSREGLSPVSPAKTADSVYRGDLALSHSNMGLLQSETGEAGRAKASFREAIHVLPF